MGRRAVGRDSKKVKGRMGTVGRRWEEGDCRKR